MTCAVYSQDKLQRLLGEVESLRAGNTVQIRKVGAELERLHLSNSQQMSELQNKYEVTCDKHFQCSNACVICI